MVRGLVLLAVAGCNQVYGLDETRLPPDAAQFAVHGQLIGRRIENSGGLPTLIDAPLSLTNTLYLSRRTDGAEDAVPIDSDDRFTFSRAAPDEPYRLELTIDGEIFELQGNSPEIRFVVRTAGRLNPDPIEDRFVVRFPQAPNTERGAVASTGIWACGDTGAIAGEYAINWQFPERTSTRHGLVNAERGDVLYTLDYERRTSVEGKQYLGIAGAQRHSVVMKDDGITLPMPPRVTPLPCSKLVGAQAQVNSRLRAALPPEWSFLVDFWGISAVGSLEIGVSGTADVAVGTSSPSGDIAVTPTIANPITGSTLLASSGILYQRTLKHPNAASGIPLTTTLVHAVPLDCAVPETTIAADAIGLPGNFRINGIALAGEPTEIAASDTDLEITWEHVADGATDINTAVLIEVKNEPTFDSTGFRVARTYQTTAPRLLVSPSTVVRGRYYILQLTAQTGLPDAKNGDISTLRYPYSGLITYSPLFFIR